ncbi:MAG: hypothetical protein II822_10415 [Prevotella sp.]|nr:hypothetical protein [Prevotella sp.]
MKLNRDKIQRMIGPVSGSSQTGGAAGAGGVSEAWVNQNFVSIEFFNRLFKIGGTKTETDETTGETTTTAVDVLPNDTATTITDIGALFSLYSVKGVSALGLGSGGSGGGGGGGATSLAELTDVALSSPQAGQVLKYDGTHWVNGTDQGVTSLAWTSITNKPTTISGYGITDAKIENGTITLGGSTLTPLTSAAFSQLTANGVNISATIGIQTRTVQAPTIKSNGTHAETASSAAIPSQVMAGVMFGTDKGLYMTETYGDDATPVSYGNILNIIGGGGGQLLAEWCGDYTTGHLYYRSHRDVTDSGGWTPWKKVLFADDSISVGRLSGNGSYTAWGRTYWANGVPNSISGNMTDVGNITMTGSVIGPVSIELNTNGTLINFGGYIDFHYQGSSADYTSRIIEETSGMLSLVAPNGVRIGDAVLVWDNTNNALKVTRIVSGVEQACNLYATGGVSALGMSSGGGATISNLTVEGAVKMKDFAGSAPNALSVTKGTSATDINWLEIGGGWNSQYHHTRMSGFNVQLVANIYTMTLDANGKLTCPNDVQASRFYLDSTRYLYVSSGTLYYYNGSASRAVAFT